MSLPGRCNFLFAATSVVALAAASACTDLDQYETGPGMVYRGAVVGGEEGTFIRKSFAAGTTLEMTFHPPPASEPGEIRTVDRDCDGHATFDATPLERIEALEHDLIADYDFPGAGRVRNFMYAARPELGPLAGRDAMVFVSLIEDDSIEVRLVAGANRGCRIDDCEALRQHECDYFGFFRLRKGPR